MVEVLDEDDYRKIMYKISQLSDRISILEDRLEIAPKLCKIDEQYTGRKRR